MEKYKKSYTISSFEVDMNDKLRVHSLFNLFQDIADEHAEKIGVGYTYCSENGIGWVGGAYHLKINALPTWGDKVTIETWPSATTAACGIREFQMQDKEGHSLVEATSQWVLIDATRLRPIPIAKHLPAYEVIPERALDSDFAKIPTPEGTPDIRIFPVHADDIDLNKHVNNALYPTWVLDSFNEEFRLHHIPSEIKVAFRRSARFGDEIKLATYVQGEETLSLLTSPDGQIEFARVSMIWQKV